MPRWPLLSRLMMRPLFHEPVRLGLMVLAVGLGVAVVLAIELAGTAAAGSFHSSMETLGGDNDLEVVASGGVPESVLATLSSQPFPLGISSRIEDYATVTASKQTLPLIGLDLIAKGSRYISQDSTNASTQPSDGSPAESLKRMQDPASIWVGSRLGKKPGDRLQLLINDRTLFCTVRGVYPDSNGNDSAILMDIAAAQKALNRFGRVDRILLKLPAGADLNASQERIQTVLPAGVDVHPQGTATNENRKMLAAFRLNLRLLSYIALVVCAFLIYNT